MEREELLFLLVFTGFGHVERRREPPPLPQAEGGGQAGPVIDRLPALLHSRLHPAEAPAIVLPVHLLAVVQDPVSDRHGDPRNLLAEQLFQLPFVEGHLVLSGSQAVHVVCHKGKYLVRVSLCHIGLEEGFQDRV